MNELEINVSKPNRPYKSSIIFLVAGLLIGFFIGYYYEQKITRKRWGELKPVRTITGNYKFIRPLLVFNYPYTQESSFQKIKADVKNLINQAKQDGQIEKAAFYFQDLNGARWIGFNEDDQYDPASLLKVLVLIDYLKKSEKEPDFLNKKFVYTADIAKINLDNQFNSPSELKINSSYTIHDLLDKMIIKSDNGAKDLLIKNVDRESLFDIYNTADFPRPNTINKSQLSPRIYFLIFRVLYNATYLNQDLSEQALALLAQTNFNEGLVAGVPEKTVVAHKFGLRAVTDDQGKKIGLELHDCGIIYFPGAPYFLCVMTQGDNTDDLQGIIRDISNLVYQGFLGVPKIAT